ncbi:spore coat associated protein CotJA [Clostridium taeniosporum]|nr:spore coat associated protein CotJA [Clostridium taeniosporum]
MYNFKLKEYARAYILPQCYENLFTCVDGFKKGTIFKDLYKPYNENKKYNC